jgi:nitroimidazol reductase NimA-like FMN-containing flavoprotein (pyridoxamine 5'-phosphate oxidase superfamily)
MWIDQRGSEVLSRTECLRLLTVKAGGIGRLGIVVDGQPVVVPLNYSMVDGDIVLRVGPGTILATIRDGNSIVAFEIDEVPVETDAPRWNVLAQGSAREVSGGPRLAEFQASGPVPAVPEPGATLVRISADVLSGRRFSPGGGS